MAAAMRARAPEIVRQDHRALDDEKRRSARSGDRVLMQLAGGKLVRRQLQGRVPEGARAQDRAARLDGDLPVEATERLLKARLGWLLRKLDGAAGGPLEADGELAKMRLELDGHAPLDMMLEEEQEAEPGERQGEHDGGGARRQEAAPERAPPHAAGRSGTR
jgi:hypothetical protein